MSKSSRKLELYFVINIGDKMDKIITRAEVSSNDKWNIDLIYENIDSFNKDLEKIHKEIDNLINLSEGFLDNSENLKE